MRLRAVALQERGGEGRERGSCAFNLTLINRMESSATKRDLKPDPLFAMGKCSVSWHADSCLQDFSTIGAELAVVAERLLLPAVQALAKYDIVASFSRFFSSPCLCVVQNE